MKDNCKLPKTSLLFEQSKHCDYVDSFTVSLQRSDVESWEPVSAFFQTSPKWVNHLFLLRNKLASAIGLKTGFGNPVRLQPPYTKGQQLGLFRIHDINENEAVLGQDDKHLNFKISFLIEQGANNSLTVSTIVKVNNFFGTIYFFFVKKIHRLIVPVMVNRMVKSIDQNLTVPIN